MTFVGLRLVLPMVAVQISDPIQARKKVGLRLLVTTGWHLGGYLWDVVEGLDTIYWMT